MSGCKLRRLLCLSSRINLFTSMSSGTHTLPWNLSMSSLPKAKSFASPDPSCSLTLFKLASNNCLSLSESRKSLDIVRLLHLMNSDSNSTCSFISLNFPSSFTSWSWGVQYVQPSYSRHQPLHSPSPNDIGAQSHNPSGIPSTSSVSCWAPSDRINIWGSCGRWTHKTGHRRDNASKSSRQTQ